MSSSTKSKKTVKKPLTYEEYSPKTKKSRRSDSELYNIQSSDYKWMIAPFIVTQLLLIAILLYFWVQDRVICGGISASECGSYGTVFALIIIIPIWALISLVSFVPFLIGIFRFVKHIKVKQK